MKKDITLNDLLKKYNLLNDSVKTMAWHMGILRVECSKIGRVCGIDIKEMAENEVATSLANAINSCDLSNPNCNEKLYLELARLGLSEIQNYSLKTADDEEEVDYYNGGNELYTDEYDRYVDGIADREHSRHI